MVTSVFIKLRYKSEKYKKIVIYLLKNTVTDPFHVNMNNILNEKSTLPKQKLMRKSDSVLHFCMSF